MSIRIIHGDCREKMQELIADGVQFDSCVTDPPYHLTSTVKRFGKENSAPCQPIDGAAGVYARSSKGFMGKQWDGGDVAFRVETWRLVYDLLKPGGYLLAFSGTRTYHRMAVTIEDAGFEIRDQIGWLYGSGFPKSHDVSKSIDKAAGHWRGRAGEKTRAGESFGQEYERKNKGTPITEDAAKWQGWGTALKPAWEPIVVARKPLIGTVADNVLQHGTGAMNIDTSRIPMNGEVLIRPSVVNGKKTNAHMEWRPWMQERIDNGMPLKDDFKNDYGRWPTNIIHDGSDEVTDSFPDDAARFFYSAKAQDGDRCGSKHPTIKPTDLMAYLCRLITQPGGMILDPFAGSGSLGMAAMREGFNATLIEREAEYVADIERRIAHVHGSNTPLFSEPKQMQLAEVTG